MGYDLLSVKDFLEDKCIVGENIEIVIDHMNNPTYENALKRNYQPPFNPMKAGPVNYEYLDNYKYSPNNNVSMLSAG